MAAFVRKHWAIIAATLLVVTLPTPWAAGADIAVGFALLLVSVVRTQKAGDLLALHRASGLALDGVAFCMAGVVLAVLAVAAHALGWGWL